jgi:hypothetical protein
MSLLLPLTDPSPKHLSENIQSGALKSSLYHSPVGDAGSALSPHPVIAEHVSGSSLPWT